MLKHLIIGIALASALVWPSVRTHAQSDSPPPSDSTVDAPAPDNGGSDPTPTFGNNDQGEIESGLDGGPSGGGGGSPGPASFGPQCTWTPATINSLGGPSLPGDIVDDLDPNKQVVNSDGQFGWLRFCPGDLIAQFVWQSPVDPVDLVPGASARARARLPLPVPNMSPAPEVGSVVNLGVWFAIDDPGVTTARATLGDAWAQVTGTFARVSIEPGDGSPPVVCDGFGTPYPEGANDPDEGPCGHTYLERTPDDQPHQLTYTITYDLNWSTSDGQSGSLGTFDRPAVFDYDIDEIQTVGTG